MWNASTVLTMYPTYYGAPNAPLRPIHLAGLRNGTVSGQFVVSSPDTIKGFKAVASELKSKTGAVIPFSAITLGYARWVQHFASATTGKCVQNDPLDTATPDRRGGQGAEEVNGRLEIIDNCAAVTRADGEVFLRGMIQPAVSWHFCVPKDQWAKDPYGACLRQTEAVWPVYF